MDEVIKTVSETLEKDADVLALFLFGSRARNENEEGSDYDFYVILDKNARDSLREDEIHGRIMEVTKSYKQEIHLTFQYLFVVNEDKSLILKISSEGRLIFSKTYLIAPHKQFGLQRYFICRWEVNEKRFGGGNKKEFIRTGKLLINRLLYGYTQKYTYGGELKESKRVGLVDNKNIFGEGGMIIIPDMTFDFIRYFIEKNRGKLIVMKILNSCYIPRESVNIEKYDMKKKLEQFIKNRTNAGMDLFVTSIAPFDLDKICVKFEDIRKGQKMNTIIPIKELPPELQKNAIIRKKYEF